MKKNQDEFYYQDACVRYQTNSSEKATHHFLTKQEMFSAAIDSDNILVIEPQSNNGFNFSTKVIEPIKGDFQANQTLSFASPFSNLDVGKAYLIYFSSNSEIPCNSITAAESEFGTDTKLVIDIVNHQITVNKAKQRTP